MKDLTQLDPVALRTLATAVGLGTFEAAARELHVTPSAVSQRVKALETRVGRVLVHRVKPLEATEAGQVLVRLAAQQELLERDAVAELLEDEDAGEDTPYAAVPLAVNSDALHTWLIDALVAVQAEHRVTFELVRADQSRTAERLRRGDVMAALTSDPRPVPGCRVVRLGRMRYRAVATPAWRAAHLPDGPTPTALSRAPMIVSTAATPAARLPAQGHPPAPAPPAAFIPSVAQFENAVRRGMGWGMLLEREGSWTRSGAATWWSWCRVATSTCRFTGSTGGWSPRPSRTWTPDGHRRPRAPWLG